MFGAGVYIFRRTPGTWVQEAYIKASNTAASDHFGDAIALWGDTLVVGAPWEDAPAADNQLSDAATDSSAAYVFTRQGSSWTQTAFLKAPHVDAGDGFGDAVALWGDRLVVGAPGEASVATGPNGDQTSNAAPGAGAAYVYARNGTAWQLDAYLKAINTGAGDAFGTAVGVWNDTVVVGAPLEDSAVRPA